MLKANNSKQSYADKFQKRNEIIKTSSNSKSYTPAKAVKGSPRTDNISSVNKSSADNNSGNVTQFIAFDSIKDVNNGDNSNNSKINNRFDDAPSSYTRQQPDVQYATRQSSQSYNEDVLSQKSDLSESFNEDDDEEHYDNDDYADQGDYNNPDYIVNSTTNPQPQSSIQQPYVYPDRQLQQQPLPAPALPSNQQKIGPRQQHPPPLPAAQYRSEQQQQLRQQRQRQQQQHTSNPQYTEGYFKAHDDNTVNLEIERLEHEINGYKEKETASSYIDGKFKFVAGDQNNNSGSTSGNSNNSSLVKTPNAKKITYKPYTLEQYKQMQPKEYVEIVPKLKPGKLNCIVSLCSSFYFLSFIYVSRI